MRYVTWLREACGLALLISLLGGMPARADDAAADEVKDKIKETKEAAKEIAKEAKEKAEKVREEVKEEVRRRVVWRGDSSRYQLGIGLSPLSAALKAQLDLKDGGLVVDHVDPEGVAGKAGIKQYDIIVGVGDAAVQSHGQLAKAIDQSEGKEVSLKVIRGGKPMTIAVTPGKREETFNFKFPGINKEEIEILVRDKLKEAGVDVRMELLAPGKIYGPGMSGKWRTLPDDLSVTIRKRGKDAAEYEVKRGDQTWTVKEDELDKLPEDVRKHVESMRGHGGMQIHWDGPKAVISPVSPVTPFSPKAARAASPARPKREEATERALDRRMEEMARRMQEMNRQMEELRKNLRSRDKDKDEKPKDSE